MLSLFQLTGSVFKIRSIFALQIVTVDMKHIGFKFSVVLFFAVVAMISCKKEDQMAIDEELIMNFIAEHQSDFNGNEAQRTESGLYYVIEEPGSADHPTLQSEVTVSYIGIFLDGVIFDNGNDITFPLTNVIQGWQEGIPLFGRGGKGWLMIPSHLGYGNTFRPGIPPNSVLVFYIELKDFQ